MNPENGLISAGPQHPSDPAPTAPWHRIEVGTPEPEVEALPPGQSPTPPTGGRPNQTHPGPRTGRLAVALCGQVAEAVDGRGPCPDGPGSRGNVGRSAVWR
jgi:hypothetical protein